MKFLFDQSAPSRLFAPPCGLPQMEQNCVIEVLPAPLDPHVGLVNPPRERQPAAVPSRSPAKCRHRNTATNRPLLVTYPVSLAVLRRFLQRFRSSCLSG